jgi:hypothetical protein
MMDQKMKRCPLDGNARPLEPETELGENIVNEPLIARAVRQPAHDLVVVMRNNRIDVWRRVHDMLLSRDRDRRSSDMSCSRSTASMESAAICWRASGCDRGFDHAHGIARSGIPVVSRWLWRRRQCELYQDFHNHFMTSHFLAQISRNISGVGLFPDRRVRRALLAWRIPGKLADG